MEKKRQVYTESQIERYKKDIIGIVEYLQSLDLKKAEDKVEYKSIGGGILAPYISSTWEKIVETVVYEIQRSADIIITLFEAEGMTENLEAQIKTTIDKLNELNEFYLEQKQVDMTNRVVDITFGAKKDGTPKNYRLIAATQEDQVRARGRISKAVTKLIFSIDIIKTYNTSTVRGGAEATPAMIRFQKRRAEQKDRMLNESD